MFTYLRSALDSVAYQTIKGFEVTSANYHHAIGETGQDGCRVRRAHGAPSKVMPLELKFHVRKKKR